MGTRGEHSSAEVSPGRTSEPSRRLSLSEFRVLALQLYGGVSLSIGHALMGHRPALAVTLGARCRDSVEGPGVSLAPCGRGNHEVKVEPIEFLVLWTTRDGLVERPRSGSSRWGRACAHPHRRLRYSTRTGTWSNGIGSLAVARTLCGVICSWETSRS